MFLTCIIWKNALLIEFLRMIQLKISDDFCVHSFIEHLHLICGKGSSLAFSLLHKSNLPYEMRYLLRYHMKWLYIGFYKYVFKITSQVGFKLGLC